MRFMAIYRLMKIYYLLMDQSDLGVVKVSHILSFHH